MTLKNLDTTAYTVGGTAAMLGGLAWLLLIPAAELHRRELFSYDGYNRLLAIPLPLFLVALLALSRALTVTGRSARAGLLASAVGVGLLLAGNVVEFYGVLLRDQRNAYAAAQAGEVQHWVGSDVGWIVFGVGMLVLLVGGLVAAAGMQRHRVRPSWLVAFTAALGVGVLAANLFALRSALLSVPVLVFYAVGWIAFGLLTRRGGVSRSAVTGTAAGPVWHLVFMGVSGSGKSTVAEAVNARLGWEFAEGDDFHSRANVDKMAAGRPLTDEDRIPWLEALAAWTRERDRDGTPTLMSCSALRRSYRDILRRGGEHTFFVHLAGDKGLLLQRMNSREQHFMPPDLLESQLDTLEPLAEDEAGIVLDVADPPDSLAEEVLQRLGLP